MLKRPFHNDDNSISCQHLRVSIAYDIFAYLYKFNDFSGPRACISKRLSVKPITKAKRKDLPKNPFILSFQYGNITQITVTNWSHQLLMVIIKTKSNILIVPVYIWLDSKYYQGKGKYVVGLYDLTDFWFGFSNLFLDIS